MAPCQNPTASVSPLDPSPTIWSNGSTGVNSVVGSVSPPYQNGGTSSSINGTSPYLYSSSTAAAAANGWISPVVATSGYTPGADAGSGSTVGGGISVSNGSNASTLIGQQSSNIWSDAYGNDDSGSFFVADPADTAARYIPPPILSMQQQHVQCVELLFPREVIAKRYKDVQLLTAGRYGQVASAVEIYAKQGVPHRKVAIKRLQPLGDRRLALLTLRELRILTRFNHPNIIEIVDVMFDSKYNLYMVQPRMETDLAYLLRHARQPYGPRFNMHDIRRIMYQTLCALKYVHSAKVIHRDVKPENLLVNHSYSSYQVKLCDFGLARVDALDMSDDERSRSALAQYTKYVGSVSYQAPELVLPGVYTYTRAVDIWSAGCILAEMLDCMPLFRVKSFSKQFEAIVSVLGTPTGDELRAILSRTHVDELVAAFVKAIPYRERIFWAHRYPQADPDALVLLNQMLQYNPAARPRAEQLLATSEFLSTYANPQFELTCPLPFEAGDMEVDALSWPLLCQELQKEVDGFRSRAETVPTHNHGARMPAQKQFFTNSIQTPTTMAAGARGSVALAVVNNTSENFDGNVMNNNTTSAATNMRRVY